LHAEAMNAAKDLNVEPPRSPRDRIGDYVILARCLDKGRAELNGTAGGFHFNCPLDNMLFNFKGVNGEDVGNLLRDGASDDEVLAWLNSHGIDRSPEEIADWSAQMARARPYDDPERREWFAGECARLGLNPATTTLFDYLDEDDRQLALQAA
jgi:Domain of unknown function (DUF5069)